MRATPGVVDESARVTRPVQEEAVEVERCHQAGANLGYLTLGNAEHRHEPAALRDARRGRETIRRL
jgi:hypothetical protein